jgi:endoglucanase
MYKLISSLFLLFACVGAFAQSLNQSIRLNQVGFYPQAPKLAVVTGSTSETSFFITSTNLRDTVFRGSLGALRKSNNSSTETRIADFSALTKPGTYVVLVPKLGHSYVFVIGDKVNEAVGIASLKAYYYQRASMPLEEKYAGKWHRSVGHPDDVVLIHPAAVSANRAAGSVISTPGGWYDAGDYNKYIVNSGITMGTMLSAYEDFPDYFKKLPLNIPESGNRTPDILNELAYNLRWMLTMQDPGDGGVYNKCTNASFDGMVMPGVTRAPRYVVQKGVAATLDFAAVTAQAARIYSAFNKPLADSCMKAAKYAWEWALKNPALDYDQNAMNKKFKPEVVTGAYGDKNYSDEWFWAGTELFVSTKEEKYFKGLNEKLSLPSWSNVAMLGIYTALRFENKLPAAKKELLKPVREKLIAMADEYISKAGNNAFSTVMGQTPRDYNWGGNSNAANQGILLVRAYLLSGNKQYIDHALSNIDYILGRNATGYSFVTGIGSKSPMFPHHRQSTADGVTEPVPGMVVGGPNPGMQDKCTYAFTEPETAYSDNDCSYASNEIAINWNAPFVYLTNALEALKGKVGYVGK